MKIRTGFVSNSSSSSFVVYNTTTSQVTLEMLEIINQDWKEYDENKRNHPKYKEVKKFLKSQPNLDGNIIIPWSTNYATYIFKDRRKEPICINTCNNHDWGSSEKIDFEFKGEEYDPMTPEKDLFLDLNDFKMRTVEEYEELEMKELQKYINSEN